MAIYQGTYFEQTFALTDENDAAINLTGFTFEADVRATVASSTTLFTLTSGSGLDIVSAAGGTLKVSMTAVQTALLAVGRIVLDVHHLNASPGPVFLFRVSAKVRQSVTR